MKKINVQKCFTSEPRYSKEIDVKFEQASETPIEFNFKVESDYKPGSVSLKTGFNKDPNYDSIFILNPTQTRDLAYALLEAAEDSNNRRLLDHEAYINEGKLSYMILHKLIDTVRVFRDFTGTDDFQPPFYAYTFKAYKDKECVLAYKTIINLDFSSEKEFLRWKQLFTNNNSIEVYFDNFDPLEISKKNEEKRRKEFENVSIDEILKINPTLAEQIKSINKCPAPIQKQDTSDNNVIDFLNRK